MEDPWSFHMFFAHVEFPWKFHVGKNMKTPWKFHGILKKFMEDFREGWKGLEVPGSGFGSRSPAKFNLLFIVSNFTSSKNFVNIHP